MGDYGATVICAEIRLNYSLPVKNRIAMLDKALIFIALQKQLYYKMFIANKLINVRK